MHSKTVKYAYIYALKKGKICFTNALKIQKYAVKFPKKVFIKTVGIAGIRIHK